MVPEDGCFVGGMFMKTIIAAVLVVFATSASATWSDDDNYNYNWNYPTATGYGGDGGNASSRSTANADATGVGIGVGIGEGGNARSNSYSDGGNAAALGLGGKSAADASIGDVTVRGGAVSGRQDVDVYSRNAQDQAQSQRNSNSAVGSGNDTTITYQGDTYPVQKKPDVPAIAPSVATGAPTAPCYIPFGASGAYGGIVSIGGSGAIKDHGCALGEVARRAVQVGDLDTAQEALDLMFLTVKADAGLIEPTQDEAQATFSSSDHPTDDPLYFAR